MTEEEVRAQLLLLAEHGLRMGDRVKSRFGATLSELFPLYTDLARQHAARRLTEYPHVVAGVARASGRTYVTLIRTDRASQAIITADPRYLDKENS